MLTPNDLKSIKQVVKETLKEELVIELTPIKKDVKKLQKDVKVILSFFDTEIVDLKIRVDQLEKNKSWS